MVSTYDYYSDTESNPHPTDGAAYRCLMNKRGICDDFAALYCYLLMQCGVSAQDVGCRDHAWTFAVVDGKGYHIDPTWGLKSTVSEKSDSCFTLQFFMMTSERREEDGFDLENMWVSLLPQTLAVNCTECDFTADDDFYLLPIGSSCSRYDTERNILYYRIEGETWEYRFKYESGK